MRLEADVEMSSTRSSVLVEVGPSGPATCVVKDGQALCAKSGATSELSRASVTRHIPLGFHGCTPSGSEVWTACRQP